MKYGYLCIIMNAAHCWSTQPSSLVTPLLEPGNLEESAKRRCIINKYKMLGYLVRASTLASGAIQLAQGCRGSEADIYDVSALTLADCATNFVLSIGGLVIGTWLIDHAHHKEQEINESYAAEDIAPIEIQDALECNASIKWIAISSIALSCRVATSAIACAIPAPASNFINFIGGITTLAIPITFRIRSCLAPKAPVELENSASE